MAFQMGDAVLVPFLFTNLRDSKVRPAVVLSSAKYHATEPDVILGAITTNLAGAATPVDHVLADWQAANLRYPSAFKPIVFTLEPGLILHRVGALSRGDIAEIDQRLRLVLALEAAPTEKES